MTQPTPKRAALVLVAQSPLVDMVRQAIIEDLRAELPADVGVILLDSRVKIAAILPAAE